MSRRSFLFLQGVCSPFFAQLADRLRRDGHRVHKAHFNAGDVACWLPRQAAHFRGKLESLPAFLDDQYRRYGITDQVLFGDRRPVHRPAVAHGAACGVRTHVFEEGYFRPHWVTLEREGVNGHSLLPRDPTWFWKVGGRLSDARATVPFTSRFSARATRDVIYNLAGLTNVVLFPRYRSHAPVPAFLEYAGYIKRFSRLRMIRQREQRRVRELIESNAPYYVLPLQLHTDAQIRDHSRFGSMHEVIEYVLQSFAHHAPPNALIAIKNHPLDAGLVNHARAIRDAARELGLAERVRYYEDGDLWTLFKHSAGVVTVNSTAGLVALELGRPTLTLSDPIYNLPGLTHRGTLDAFWIDAVPPDAKLFCRFRRAVMHATQVNGGFYCRNGIPLAVENSVPFLEAERSPLEMLL